MFPVDYSIYEVIYLAIKDESKKWIMSIHNWRLAMNRLLSSSVIV